MVENSLRQPADLKPGKPTALVSSLRRICLLASLGFSVVAFTGCGLVGKRVSAYERAVLSKPGMALVINDREQAAMNHMFNAREGSAGGLGGAGGGCGCN